MRRRSELGRALVLLRVQGSRGARVSSASYRACVLLAVQSREPTSAALWAHLASVDASCGSGLFAAASRPRLWTPAAVAAAPSPGAATAQRQGEPAWHRRHRRARGSARVLLRVAAAANLLQRHHSAQRQGPMPNGAAAGKGQRTGAAGATKGGGKGGGIGSAPLASDWACILCNYQGNRDWRRRCRRCDALRNDERARELSLGRTSTLAERQVQQQHTAHQQQLQQQKKKAEAEHKKLRDEVEKLRELVASRTSPQSNTVGGDVEDGGDEMDEGAPYAAWSEEDRAKRLELAKGGLAYAIEAQGDDSAQAESCRNEIAALQRASREAKPFKAHRAQLERRRERLRGQQERDEEAIEKAQADIKSLQEKVDSLKATVAERAKTLAEVTDELKSIVKKALDEEAEGEPTNKPPWAQEANPWKAMSAAIAGLAGQQGVPAEFTALLQHVQQVAAAIAAQQPQPPAPNPPTPTPTQAGSSSSATSQPGKTNLSAAAVPAALAPHAKAGTAPPKSTTPQPDPRPPPATAGKGTEDNTRESEAGTEQASSKPADETSQGASPAAAAGVGESEPELVDDDANDDSAMSVDLENSLALLPEGDRHKVRAAIQRGRFRPRGRREEENTGSRRDERERSPRPGKSGESEDL